MILQPAATFRSRNGMVCAIDHLAAGAGVEMLRRGGSAADAAIATNAVLAVTAQHLCGLGGDLFAVVIPPGEKPIVLNASGRAGSGADPDRLRRQGHTVMPFWNDIASVTVPGCVDGWVTLHERFGKLPLAEVLEPGRRYAAEGFPASPTLVEDFPAVEGLADAADFTESGPLRVGSIVRRPGVARTLAAIAKGGREAFYEGEFGEGLLRIGAGEFGEADLATSGADWVEAISVEAFGARIWSAPPNSQGYLTLAGAFIASGLELPSDPDDDALAHLLIEASRQAAFDRLDVLAEGVDGSALLRLTELERRREAIDPEKAAVLGDRYNEGGTTALLAVDTDRLCISVIQSNASGFGSRIIVPGVRIFLHNRGIGFSLEEGHPAEYGPGKRPAHTLCPTAVTNLDGSARGVLGTMGGDSQPQILLQLLARWLHCGQKPGDALAAGRFVLMDPGGGGSFDTWRSRGRVEVVLEGQAPASWDAALTRRGHRTRRLPAFSRQFGHAHLISIDGDGFSGAAEPRVRFGAAAAY
jgi:gamma-glutamyltranspeptidase / glutathione hydrolase